MRGLLGSVIAACVVVLGSACSSGYVYLPIDLGIANYTALPVTLFVNGTEVGTYPPGSSEHPIPASLLPDSPWRAEARTSTGRVLLTLDVKPGDAWYTTPGPDGRSSASHPAALVNLSCGRLDLFSIAALGGPAPPSSFPPGDCDP